MSNWQPFYILLMGMSCMSYLCFFCLQCITCQSTSHIYTGLILLITQNFPGYLLFAFCLFVWLIQPKYFSGLYVIMRGWHGGNWSHELLGVRQITAWPHTPLYIMTPLGTRPGLGTQPCYQAPCDLQIKCRQNIVISIQRVWLLPQ